MGEEQPRFHRVRKVRRDRGRVKWTPRDLAVLAWIGEQYLVRLDHLQVLLGRQAGAATKEQGRVARKTAGNTVARWRKAGVVEAAQILAYQPAYVWLTRQGLTLVQLPYSLWTPKEGVAHYQAINQARLLVELHHPAALWRSERRLNSERPFTRSQSQVEHRPDAELLIGALTVAIEVERTAKTPQRLPAILYGLARRYDGIWYFCPKPMQEAMQRALAQLDPAMRQNCSQVLLPHERSAAAGEPTTPPRPRSMRRRQASSKSGATEAEGQATSGCPNPVREEDHQPQHHQCLHEADEGVCWTVPA